MLARQGKMIAKAPPITIVIVNYNDKHFLGECSASLKKLGLSPGQIRGTKWARIPVKWYKKSSHGKTLH
jgi:hypothetical protein